MELKQKKTETEKPAETGASPKTAPLKTTGNIKQAESVALIANPKIETPKTTAKPEINQGIKRTYTKDKKRCAVTFCLPKEAAKGAANVHLVGQFNNWDISANTMKKSEIGEFTETISLEAGKEYQFRYLINNDKWENDWSADKYIPNNYGGDNSVVVL